LLNTPGEALPLLIIFGVLNLGLPLGLGLLAAWLSRFLSKKPEPLVNTLSNYAPAFAPLAFAIWLAHYGGFHFLSSAMGIIPLFQSFLRDHQLNFVGQPNWALGPVVPVNWLDGLEIMMLLVGFGASYLVLMRRARLNGRKDKIMAQLPWLLLLIGLVAAAMWIFALPMEMRGSSFMS
jgi:hypothetical protein